MKRTILIVLCLAAVDTFAIAQAQEDTKASDCETADEGCGFGGTVDGCEEDCDECDCGSECEDCEGCEETVSDCKDCAGDDCYCDDCSSEEEFQHCGGCQ